MGRYDGLIEHFSGYVSYRMDTVQKHLILHIHQDASTWMCVLMLINLHYQKWLCKMCDSAEWITPFKITHILKSTILKPLLEAYYSAKEWITFLCKQLK